MEAWDVTDLLEALVEDAANNEESDYHYDFGGARTVPFNEAGVLTSDKGFVLRMPGGEVFHVTVQRAR